MNAFVIDTNVAVVANGRSTHADSACVLACIRELNICRKGIIVLDSEWFILKEYQKNLQSGGPGAGNSFLKWLFENKDSPERCEQVSLARKANSDDFLLFPKDPALQSFDRNDRKFVVAALASQNQPELLNAVDKHWWRYRKALEQNGIRLKFLCPQNMS